MQQEPDFLHNLNQEFRDGRRWLDRTIVLAYAAAAGLCVVAFTLMADAGFELFESIYHWQGGWAVLLWMPAVTAGGRGVPRGRGAGAGGGGGSPGGGGTGGGGGGGEGGGGGWAGS